MNFFSWLVLSCILDNKTEIFKYHAFLGSELFQPIFELEWILGTPESVTDRSKVQVGWGPQLAAEVGAVLLGTVPLSLWGLMPAPGDECQNGMAVHLGGIGINEH